MLTYRHTTLADLYRDTRSSIATEWEAAVAWVEAENVYRVWELVQQWFEAIQTGQADKRMPDPFWRDEIYPGRRAITAQVADQVISEMDADFELERGRFNGRLAPEFARLPPATRIAFAQDLYRTLKTHKEMLVEARRRLARGEKLPPEHWDNIERPIGIR